MLPSDVKIYLEKELQSPIALEKPLLGGDIHRVVHLQLADGRQLVLKYNRGEQAAEMLRTEALGLALLGASGAIATPKVFRRGSAGPQWPLLLMEYIVPGHQNRSFWEQFGLGLANLHGNTSAQFGFAHNNFIGSLPQTNQRADRWSDFYAEQRLLPQMALAIHDGKLEQADLRRVEALCRRLNSICPEEAPSLVHGDLWSGNFLCNLHGKPVLIDPAASFSHRETDLAMSRLFGGFDPMFYAAYQANYPLAPGFEQRLEVYQLYYLLVHVNLFGGGYVEQVRGILKRY